MEILTRDQELKALSWRQPYADLMFAGKIETRTWPTKYRGWVLICASQKAYPYDQVLAISGEQQTSRLIDYVVEKTKKQEEHFEKTLKDLNALVGIDGHALGIGRLVDCRRMKPEDEQACYVEYHEHLWCHVYEDVQRIIPFKFKGGQKWTEPNAIQRNSIIILK